MIKIYWVYYNHSVKYFGYYFRYIMTLMLKITHLIWVFIYAEFAHPTKLNFSSIHVFIYSLKSPNSPHTITHKLTTNFSSYDINIIFLRFSTVSFISTAKSSVIFIIYIYIYIWRPTPQRAKGRACTQLVITNTTWKTHLDEKITGMFVKITLCPKHHYTIIKNDIRNSR